MITIFLSYYCNTLLFILLFYVVGHLISHFLKLKNASTYFDLFSKILLGLIVITCLFAIFKSSFQTILLGSVLLIFPFLKQTNKTTLEDTKTPSSLALFAFLGEFLFISALIVIIRVSMLYGDNGQLELPNFDYIFYSKIATYLGTIGIETTHLDYLNIASNGSNADNAGLAPYHYFELWLSSIINNVGFGISVYNLSITTFSLLTILIYLGLLSILNEFCKITIYVKLLVFLGLFTQGYSLFLFDYIPLLKNASALNTTLWTVPKLLSIYVFVILSVFFFIKKQPSKAIVSLLFLPLYYTPTAPALLSGIFCYIIFEYIYQKIYLKKIITSKALFVPLTYVVGVALFVAMFYYLLGDTSRISEPTLFNEKYFKTLINIIGGTSIQVCFLYLSVIILSGILYKDIINYSKQNTFLVLYFLIIGFSLLSWAVLNTDFDGVQLFSNIGLPILNVLSVLFLIFIIFMENINKNMKYATITLFLIINSTSFYKMIFENRTSRNQVFSKEFILQLSEEAKNMKNPIGVNFSSEKILVKEHFAAFADKFHRIDINILSVDGTKISMYYKQYPKTYEAVMKSNLFYKYVEKQKKNNQYKSLIQSQIDFIEEYKIEYIIATKDVVLDELLNQKIKKEIQDKLTGDRFILLK